MLLGKTILLLSLSKDDLTCHDSARGTRHIWDRYFDDAEAIIFIVAVNTYNERLSEVPTINKMEDALELFFNIVSNPLLTKISIVLFLNKGMFIVVNAPKFEVVT
jgi:hypothetical protein